MSDETHDDTVDEQPPADEGKRDDTGEFAQVPVAVGMDEISEAEKLRVPETLVVLPIRNAVAFPGTVMPLTIGREKSKAVLDPALAGSRMICVVAQRSAEVEEPGLDDLYRIGTACVILLSLIHISEPTRPY